jgi:hypothetical protein
MLFDPEDYDREPPKFATKVQNDIQYTDGDTDSQQKDQKVFFGKRVPQAQPVPTVTFSAPILVVASPKRVKRRAS